MANWPQRIVIDPSAQLQHWLKIEKLSRGDLLADLHLAGNAKDDWECFRDVFQSSALKMLGPSTYKQHDLFC